MNRVMDNQTVLVVDDDPFVRELICDILEGIGCKTLQASNGVQALDIIQSGGTEHCYVDLMVSDLNMPEMDGLTLVQSVRQICKDLPIIILTVNSEMDTAIDAIRKGADDYILKGSSIGNSLPLCVAKTFEFYELKRQNRELFIDISQKNTELERLAFLDALTGISNRRYYDVTIETEWALALEKNIPLALIFTDIDGFKGINDTYGHQVGDLCLQHVAKALNGILAGTKGVLSRYGGDEFIATLPGFSLEEAFECAQKMLRKIALTQVTDPETGDKIHLTMSFGVSATVPSSQVTVGLLFENTDRALYKAKHNGKNCVVSEKT